MLSVTDQGNRDMRPIVLNEAYINMRLLFDTGAGIPVWATTNYHLRYFFPNADKTKHLFRLSGFGGKGSDVPVYVLPRFTIKGENGNFVEFHQLHVTFANRDDPYTMIVSYNMFEHMRLIFDQQESKQICIDNPKQIYIADPHFLTYEGHTYLTEQAVFAQDSCAYKTTNFDY